MKKIKLIAPFVLIIIFIGIIWFNLPLTWKNYKKVKIGNEFAHNLRNYQKENNRLPDENDFKTLEILNKNERYATSECAWPFYKKIDEKNFTLTFLEGFDGPYLMYDSKNNQWLMTSKW